MDDKTKIILLGHTGFIGSRLFAKFREDPRFDTAGYSSRELNLLDKEKVVSFFSGQDPESVLIFCSGIGRALRDDNESFLKNIAMAAHVASALKKHPLRHSVFLSSIDVYGNPGTVILNEQSPLCPESRYGGSKKAAEVLLRDAADSHGRGLTILRLSGIYGGGRDCLSPIALWMREAKESGKLSLFGDGEDRRDYVWAEDLYPLVVRCLEKRVNGVLNAATGRSLTLLEILDRIRGLFPKPVVIVRAERQRERLDYRFDTKKLQETVGPFAWTSVEEGIRLLNG